LMRYFFHYCDHKKRSFQSNLHQKPSGGPAPPGPAGGVRPDPLGELEHSPRPLAVLMGGMGPPRRGRERDKKGGRERREGERREGERREGGKGGE